MPSSRYNLRMILDNAADGATLGASPALVASLPVGNLQKQESAYVARSTSTAEQTITFDFDSPRSVAGDMFVLLGDFSAAAEVDIVLYDAAGQTGNVVYEDTSVVWLAIPWAEFGPWGSKLWGGGKIYDSSAAQPGYIKTPRDAGGTGLYLSGKLVIRDAENPAGYHNLMRLFIGALLSPRFNLSPGYSLQLVDDSEQEPDEGGGLVTFAEEPYRVIEFELRFLDQAEFAGFWSAINSARKVSDIFVDIRPAKLGIMRASHQMRCKLADMPKFTAWTGQFFATSFTLREIK